ncbi:type IVB secretion system protein IcmH/DotU [Spongorhabdus nitratireducens]
MSSYSNSEERTQLAEGNVLESSHEKSTSSRSGGQSQALPEFSAAENPLFNLGAGLLTLIATLPRLGEPADTELFRERLVEDIQLFRRQGRRSKCHPWIVDKSSYLFCVMFDESILYTEWGRRTGWANNTLLSRLYNRRNGGEVFFLLLDRAKRYPSRLIDLLELQYVFLRLGFRGRYRHHSRQLHAITSELYQLVSRQRQPSYFFPRIEPSRSQGRRVKTRSWWRPVISLSFLLLCLVSGTAWYCIHQFNAVALELENTFFCGFPTVDPEDNPVRNQSQAVDKLLPSSGTTKQ